MVVALLISLAGAFLLCVLLGVACYRLGEDRDHARDTFQERMHEWRTEKAEVDRVLAQIVRVLNSHTGGISKRISESAEIAEAIQQDAPDLFKKNAGLAYWLHANDQFFGSLYAAAAEVIDQYHCHRVHEMIESDRADIFDRIYEEAGLPAPNTSRTINL